MVGTFGQKPSNAHVVWTNRQGEGEGKKRFDFDYLELWAAHFGIDYETRKRVDHERSDRPRQQHLVVFEWEQSSRETIRMGEDTWVLGGNETPKTFVEIDGEGQARFRNGDREAILDLRELWLEGPVMKMRTAEHGLRALDTRTLIDSDGSSEG